MKETDSSTKESKQKKIYKHTQEKRVNNQLLGNMIRNNTELIGKKTIPVPKPHSRDKYRRIHNKNIKNHSLNNKENREGNNNEIEEKNTSTEVYNLNQYCSAANLDAFCSSNFSLPKNMILSKNRSRENTGFGSPTLRRVEDSKEEKKGAFDSIMAKHGLLKDVNNLSSFNAF